MSQDFDNEFREMLVVVGREGFTEVLEHLARSKRVTKAALRLAHHPVFLLLELNDLSQFALGELGQAFQKGDIPLVVRLQPPNLCRGRLRCAQRLIMGRR